MGALISAAGSKWVGGASTTRDFCPLKARIGCDYYVDSLYGNDLFVQISDALAGEKRYFQEDGAPVRGAIKTRDRLAELQVNLAREGATSWPPGGSDLNQCDYVLRREMEHGLAKVVPKPATIEGLRPA